jgi:transposase
MNDVTLGGIELGKDALHVYGQDKSGHAVLRKKMAPKQLMTFFGNFLHDCHGADAGAHHMARQLSGFRHEVKLISPRYVKPFVKGNKNFPSRTGKACSPCDHTCPCKNRSAPRQCTR